MLKSSKGLNRILLPLVAGLFAGIGQAQAIDLLEAYRSAENNNPQLAAAREQRSARMEEVPRARSQLYPQVSVSGNARRHREDVSFEDSSQEAGFPVGGFAGEQDYETRGLSLDVSQAIYRREAFIALDQARTLETQAELEYDIARQDLALSLAEAYFDVLEAADSIESFDAELRAVENELAEAERRRELGVGGITEVNDTRARFATTRANLLQAESQLRLARRSLRRLVQSPFEEVDALAEDFAPQAPQPAEPDPWIELAEQQSREVRMAELALEVAGAGVEAARAQRYPSVDLVANWRYDYQGGAPTLGGLGIETEGTVVGIQVSLPLFLGGSISTDVRQRSAEEEASRHQLLDTRLAVALNVETAFISLQDSLEQIAAFEEALEAAVVAEESTQRSVELGQRTTLDLLNVRRERYQVQRQVAAARYQYLLAYLRLRTAVGEPVDEAVRDVNALLNNN